MRKENAASFGNVVKRLREKNGLTLRQLAAETDISPAYLLRLERGERKSPSFMITFALVKHLNMSLESLKNAFEVAYDEPKDIKLEELLLYCEKLTLNNKRLDTNFKDKLLDLVDLTLASAGQSELETKDQSLITDAAVELKTAYYSL